MTAEELGARMDRCMSIHPTLVSNDDAKRPLENLIMTASLLNRRNQIWSFMGAHAVEIAAQLDGVMEFTGTRESLYKLFLLLEQLEWGPFSQKGNSASSSSE